MENEFMPRQAHVPNATYRWQFNHLFTLRQAAELVAYLDDLGISDCYASPLLAARSGSLHGYDVTDHTRLNPELGDKEDFITFASEMKQRGMGLILDVVPNHMCIAGQGNPWWEDILEDGPGSPFAKYLDIDWHPPKTNLQNKVLLPTLGDQYGRVLENQDIQIEYQRGKFVARCYDSYLPLALDSIALVLRHVRRLAREKLDEFDLNLLELESMIAALEHLPPRTTNDRQKLKERQREKAVIRRRLAALMKQSLEMKRALEEALRLYNGVKGNPQSFDQLEELLARQSYRLCYWRVAADEINYRRFFDVNELAAIRVEEPAVFNEVHELILSLMREGWVTGLRIDHIDGLYDPSGYLENLRRGALKAFRQAEGAQATTQQQRRMDKKATHPCYVVVEKILESGERLPANWQADGTTGYDYLNLLNGVFVKAQTGDQFRRLYERFTGVAVDFKDVIYECKKLILRVALSSELHVLARKLDRISEQHRYSRDFTLNSLQDSLGEVIACYPVYRTYVRPGDREVRPEDKRVITIAIREAKRRNPALSPSLFDFIGSLLLLQHPQGLTEKQIAERTEFVMKLQQLTGPVMAKGVEDTAYYRWFPLASLNEVGGDPARFGVSLAQFHRQNEERARNWPHTMLATTTHDTKRGEDVRARLNVLSEIPGRWYRAIRRWQQLNELQRQQIAQAHPIAVFPNEEYLIYQTLVGTWPFENTAHSMDETYPQRIEEYLIKAVREAKIHSSWLSPNEEYEMALRSYVRALLTPGSDFLRDFCEFQTNIAQAGIFNSLSQTLLKITAPGIPDFYQGCELWDFNLVDPDNRRPVDYALRRNLVAGLKADSNRQPLTTLINQLLQRPEDGRIKLHLTNQALRFRQDRRELFLHGDYRLLEAQGDLKEHLIAFERTFANQQVIIVSGRFFTKLMNEGLPVGAVWKGNSIRRGNEGGCYRDVLTGRQYCAEKQEDKYALPVAELFAHLPIALLERIN